MKRGIIGFGTDEVGDPIAYLDCGHPQHVRHKPPFINRPWVMREAGRNAMLGSELDCPRCDRMEWPDGLTSYKRTEELTEATVPAGFLREHSTKRGVWGKLHVTEGELKYCVQAPVNADFAVTAPEKAVIVPQMKHHLVIDGPVRFYVEFCKRT